MDILTFHSEYPFGANTYVISSGDEYAIIDPSTSCEKILSSLNVSKEKFRYIILTHAHFDHMLFIDEWQSFTGLPVTVSEKDMKMLRNSNLNCYELFLKENKAYFGEVSAVNDGNVLKFGNTTLKIHKSPGHTPGSILIEEGNSLFVGDTVFANNGYGRCDLPGGNFQELKNYIQKIHLFDSNTVIYPGHGPKTKVLKLIRF